MAGAQQPRVVFVHSLPRFWRDLAGLAQPPAPGEIADRIRGGRNAWVLQTYLWLRRRGLDAELTTRCVPGALCVVHYDDLRARDLAAGSYLLGARADRPPMLLADQQVVQTPLLANGVSSHFIPNWPQPGLLARADLLRVNGYDETYRGWGNEDGDLRERLKRVGVWPKSIWTRAVVFHLDHPVDPSRKDRARNLAYSRRQEIPVVAESGIVKHGKT